MLIYYALCICFFSVNSYKLLCYGRTIIEYISEDSSKMQKRYGLRSR